MIDKFLKQKMKLKREYYLESKIFNKNISPRKATPTGVEYYRIYCI